MHINDFDKNDISRFWQYVEKTETCWLWLGATTSGYGQFATTTQHLLVHRMSFCLYHIQIPDKLLVLHRCDVRNCVNPEHLWLGTDDDNVQDKIAKGRNIKGEKAYNVKLLDAQIEIIRSRLNAGELGKHIAEEFGVSRSLISMIKNNKRRPQ